jgi:hypothetical protein
MVPQNETGACRAPLNRRGAPGKTAPPFENTRQQRTIRNPTRAISQAASIPGVLEELRFCRNIELVHALGVRPLYEMLAELGRDHMIRVPIEQIVERYAQRLDPAMLRITGGDRFPPAPPRLLGSAR